MSRSANYGSLTTAWSQPSSCSLPIALYQSESVEEAYPTVDTVISGVSCVSYSVNTCTTALSGTSSGSTTCFETGPYFSSTVDPACYPPVSISTDAELFNSWGFYSPGLVCPQSYTTACYTTSGGQGDWNPIWPLTEGETAAGCCPSSFLCDNDGTTQKCTSTASSVYYIQEWCYSDTSSLESASVPKVVGVGGGGGPNAGNGSEFTISEAIMYAPMIQLNFQSTDLHAVTTSTNVTSASSSTSSGTSITSPATTHSSSPPSSHGLSFGTKVGIGVGVTLGALAIIGLLAWFILRHRRAALAARQPHAPLAPELHGRDKYELPTKERATQLGAGGIENTSAELQ